MHATDGDHFLPLWTHTTVERRIHFLFLFAGTLHCGMTAWLLAAVTDCPIFQSWYTSGGLSQLAQEGTAPRPSGELCFVPCADTAAGSIPAHSTCSMEFTFFSRYVGDGGLHSQKAVSTQGTVFSEKFFSLPDVSQLSHPSSLSWVAQSPADACIMYKPICLPPANA